jgi:7-cyano-7-deazaguanine synthase in queuosine biosynthesis
VRRSVLLFSGGLDSVCMDVLLKPDVLLYTPSGSAYEERERAAVQRLCEAHPSVAQRLTVAEALNLRSWERDDYIVPNRNAHLVLIASNYGDTVWLGSVLGDRSCDKDEQFFRLMEQLLCHVWQDQHWTSARTFSVSAPMKSHTKRQLVREYLLGGGDSQRLLDSFSCYAGREQHCGQCKPCFRKWVALHHNGIAPPAEYWQAAPWRAAWLQAELPQMRAGTYRGAEDADAVSAVDAARSSKEAQ